MYGNLTMCTVAMQNDGMTNTNANPSPRVGMHAVCTVTTTTVLRGMRGKLQLVAVTGECSCGVTHKWLASAGNENAPAAMRSAHARAGASFGAWA